MMSCKKIIVKLIAVVLVLLPVVVMSAYQLAFWQKIYPGIKVAGWELSGLDRPKAIGLIEKNILSANTTEICLQSDHGKRCFTGQDIDLEYLSMGTVDRAFAVGREDNFLPNWQKRIHLLAKPTNLDLLFNFNESKLNGYIATATAQLNQPFLPPVLKVTNDQVRVVPGHQGQRIDQEGLILAIKRQLGQLSFAQPIKIPFIRIGENYSDNQLKKGRDRGQKLVGKSLLLTSRQKNFVISGEQLVGFIGLDQPWDNDRVDDYLKNLSKLMDQPAKDALFKFEGGKVTAFSLEQSGWKLGKKKTARNLIGCLNRLEKLNISRCLVEINLLQIKPRVVSWETNRLGIKELVGKGESSFTGSPQARIDNIALAAKKLDGQLIPPGETFSFDKAVGDISRKTGYKSTYIISNGRTVLGDGGGVCQVSTTLFRAALNAGLPILERWAHAYRVHYYEENSLLGMDATVFSPSVDLKFRNDLKSYILIQASFDRKNKHLIFSFFGTQDGRKAEIYNHRVWGQMPPPEDLYVDDPSLPLGVVKQVDWKAWGAKAAFDWKVTKDGAVIHKQSFFSHYRPWQAVFMKGIKASP